MNNQELIRIALSARDEAYAPYSGFSVGAALLGKSGRIYTGCNIENAAYTPTNCAERTAVFKAVSEGECEFTAIAVVGGLGDALSDVCAPCGVCRQVLAEFCESDLRIVMGTPDKIVVSTLGELLPLSFGKSDLSK